MSLKAHILPGLPSWARVALYDLAEGKGELVRLTTLGEAGVTSMEAGELCELSLAAALAVPWWWRSVVSMTFKFGGHINILEMHMLI